MVASQVNVADSEGQPVFLSRNIPTEGRDELIPEEQERSFGDRMRLRDFVRGAR